MGEVLGEQRREQWHKWVRHLGLEPGPDAVQEVERRWKGYTKMGSWARHRLESRIKGNIRGHYRVVTGVSLHRKLGGPGREGTEVSKQAGNTGCLRTQQGWDLPGATVKRRMQRGTVGRMETQRQTPGSGSKRQGRVGIARS